MLDNHGSKRMLNWRRDDLISGGVAGPGSVNL